MALRSTGFGNVSEMAFPKYVKKSRKIPWKWKFVLSLGMKLGINSELVVGKGLNHVYPLYPIPEADDAFDKICSIIQIAP